MWGARLALREPQRVRSLVLMDASLEAGEATRLRYFGMLDAIAAAGRIAPPLLDAIVPLFFRPDVNLAGWCRPRFATRSRTCRPTGCGNRSSRSAG